ncbi:Cellulose synthase-like protein G2 [Vitis vinifera]|uniref:Cellulose synthase-like protein G2 n=1 Tax=Vitis vinifera TaxID=29760 RepID=A0A438KKL4_VITVI|nr:Cellulose synthase-like protein G2 [Vitis vinifera]
MLMVTRTCTDGVIRDDNTVNEDSSAGHPNIPLLVYVSREKRPSHPHHFKAGALNTLLRVSGIISNAPHVLVLDCDFFCNDPSSARQAMCFHLDSKISCSLAFVQFPQKFHNFSMNDIYDGRLRSVFEMKCPGMDGHQGPMLSGTCFYIKRAALYGNVGEDRFLVHSVLEDYFTDSFCICKVEDGTWTASVTFSRFCPPIYGLLRMSFLESMCYAHLALNPFSSFCLWCLATIPQLCLLNGIPIYPKDVHSTGGSVQTWWNEERIWMMKSITSHFYGSLDGILKSVGMGEASFTPTNKAIQDDQVKLYQMGIFDFRTSNGATCSISNLSHFQLDFFGGRSWQSDGSWML